MRPIRVTALVTLIALNIAAFAYAPASAAHTHAGHVHRATDGDLKLAGRWSDPFWEGRADPFDPPSLDKSRKFPTAVSAVALPDGRLLYWNGFEGSEDGLFHNDAGFTWRNSRARILDLQAGEPDWKVPTEERGTTDEDYDERGNDGSYSATKDLFCSDHKLLYDGSVLIAGGTEARYRDDIYGDDETRIFDPGTDSFRSVEPMRESRWYPSLVTLADGRVVVVSGLRRVGATVAYAEPGFSQVRLNEIYDPATEKWTDAGVGDRSLPLYARLHLLPNGKVFYGGVGEYWTPFGETGDQATWSLQRVYDPASEKWTMLGPSSYTGRSGATSTLLRLEPPYDRANILIAGGTAGLAPGTWAATTLSEIVRWTPEGGIENESAPKAPVAGLAGDPTQLRNRRWSGTSVMLPTGEVLLVNGGDADDVIDPGSAAAVRTAELYDPETNEWREVATATRERVYHNSAVLLPDGRVLVGGHAPLPAHYHSHENPVTRSNNYRDSTFEIYEPPYLFRGQRPVVSNVHPVQNGRALRLTLGTDTSGSDIDEVVLVRMSANTHSIDGDQRAVELEHSVAGPHLFANLPKGGDGRILPPGPYYVFAISDSPDGPVPSIGQVVLIQPTAEGKVAAHTL